MNSPCLQFLYPNVRKVWVHITTTPFGPAVKLSTKQNANTARNAQATVSKPISQALKETLSGATLSTNCAPTGHVGGLSLIHI